MNQEIIKEIIESGADISGGIAGAAIGGLVAGPVGLIIGGVSGPIITRTIKKIGEEIRQRLISPREEIRIGAAYGYATHKIQEYIDRGIPIRDDSFFNSQNGERTNSDEIFEGVILGSQREYEERKVKFLGYLYANICFNPTIGREFANQLIKTTNSLSYRQLCILRYFQERSDNSTIDLEEIRVEVEDIIIDIRDLHQKGLLSMTNYINDINNNSDPFPLNEIKITEYGLKYCSLLSMDEITEYEIQEIELEIKSKK